MLKARNVHTFVVECNASELYGQNCNIFYCARAGPSVGGVQPLQYCELLFSRSANLLNLLSPSLLSSPHFPRRILSNNGYLINRWRLSSNLSLSLSPRLTYYDTPKVRRTFPRFHRADRPESELLRKPGN